MKLKIFIFIILLQFINLLLFGGGIPEELISDEIINNTNNIHLIFHFWNEDKEYTPVEQIITEQEEINIILSYIKNAQGMEYGACCTCAQDGDILLYNNDIILNENNRIEFLFSPKEIRSNNGCFHFTNDAINFLEQYFPN